MSELKKQWVPEVGVPCLYEGVEIEVTGAGRYGWLICAKGYTGEGYVSNQYLYRFSPIKSEAEKRRDEQIHLMENVLAGKSGELSGSDYERICKLVDAGCRMTHKITADDIAELYRKHLVTIVAGSGYEFARSIENIILGEN